MVLFLSFSFIAKMKPVKPPPKSHARGVVFEEVLTVDLDEDEQSEKKAKTPLTGYVLLVQIHLLLIHDALC